MAIVDESVNGIVKADGTAILSFRTQGRRVFVVHQVSHNGMIKGSTFVGSSATCNLFKNGRLISRTVAQGGVISGPPPLTIRGNDLMTLEYAAAVVGAGVEMTVIYDDGIAE